MEIEKFQNSLIAFDFESEFVNATDMIKAFPTKRINNFLRNQQTIDFINELESVTLISATTIKQGGLEQGTWMHKLLAYKFAAWLNPKFEVFVYSTFENAIKKQIESLKHQAVLRQHELDYFWDKSDQLDLYRR